jgi:hypothetical protein
MALERRLYLLLDGAPYRRVAAAANRRQTSVAAVIREVVRELKAEIAEGRARRL